MLRQLLLPAMFLGLISAPVMAQDASAPPPPPGDRAPAPTANGNSDRGNRGGGGFDPAQFRQRMMDRIKDQMGATDDEWKVISPKLDKVMEAERDARGGGMGMMFGGRRGRDGGNRDGGANGGNDQNRSAVQQAASDLRTTLDNKDASASDITAKLTALRDAREKAKATLQAAQKDLKDVLSQRQEATLVMMGMLD